MAPDSELLTLNGLAKAVGLPASWLSHEAAAGRIPHLRVGKRKLFVLKAVRAALVEQASRPRAEGGAAE